MKRIRIEHKFGPNIGHYRVIDEIVLNLTENRVTKLVHKLNQVFGVKCDGKMIYPRIGQTYVVYRKEAKNDD